MKPFSLACTNCDAGTDILSKKAAIAEGWTGIYYDPDGDWWTHLGICSACKKEEDDDWARRKAKYRARGQMKLWDEAEVTT